MYIGEGLGEFVMRVGVHQGSELSPLLFCHRSLELATRL